jgi:hypothetical protein
MRLLDMSLLVERVLPASRTEFLKLQLRWGIFLVLVRRIVLVLAFFARKRDELSHVKSLSSGFSTEPTTGIEPVTSSLPMTCSTD